MPLTVLTERKRGNGEMANRAHLNIVLSETDGIFAAEAPEYEKAFIRCGIKDYTIHLEPRLFHAYPMFPFVKEGKKGGK